MWVDRRLAGSGISADHLAHLATTDMFDEMTKATKEKERISYKGYATIRTNIGNLNVELHGDRVSRRRRSAGQGTNTKQMDHRLPRRYITG